MVIDIDSFLENFDSTVDEKQKNKDKNKIDLDFQKEVEDKLEKVSKKTSEGDFEVLKKIYLEVKDFDSDLGNKFLGIDSKTNTTLKELGDKYSNEFLKKIINNVKNLKNSLDYNISRINDLLNENKFEESLKILNIILKEYNLFPNDFILEKIDYSNKIRNIKILVYTNIAIFKKENLIKIKLNIKEQLINLNKNLLPGNRDLILDLISKLNYNLNNIPKIFVSDLVKENIMIEKTLIKVENFIKLEYKNEFDAKRKILANLFDKFQTNYLKSNLDEVLLVYDEILFQFSSMPETNLEYKIKIYKEINNLYSKISKLVIKNQVSSFMQGYEASKVIEEVREYLRHCNISGQVNIVNLKLLNKKLNLLPRKYDYEKEMLLNKIKNFLNKYEYKKLVNKDNLSSQNLDKKININNNNNILKNKHKILLEINNYFDKIKMSNNPNELKVYYKKIIFYLNMLNLSKEKKGEIITKVKKEIVSKKLG